MTYEDHLWAAMADAPVLGVEIQAWHDRLRLIAKLREIGAPCPDAVGVFAVWLVGDSHVRLELHEAHIRGETWELTRDWDYVPVDGPGAGPALVALRELLTEEGQ